MKPSLAGAVERSLVFLSGGVVEGRNYAETAGKAFATMKFDDIGPHGAFTASFGIAEFQHGETILYLLRRGDAALYAAKRNGRNRVEVSPALSVGQRPSAEESSRRCKTKQP